MKPLTGFDRIFANTAVERGWVKEARMDATLARRPIGLPLPDHLVASGTLSEAQRGALMGLFETVLTIPGYRIYSALGRGAMGTVYKAEDEEKNHVAIKVLSPHWAQNPEIVEQFLREATLIQKLDHPNIVRMIKTVEGSDTYCIVMEHIDGPSLSRAIAKGKFSIGEIVTIIIQVAKALAHAHETGIIHRDITPRNILLEKNKTPKLLDFGTALLRRGTEAQSQGVTAGTPIYMSPEQARGDLELQDGRTDIYSLGAVLYQALSGRAPFSGKSVEEILEKVQKEAPPDLAVAAKNLPREIIPIVETAMDKNAARRYPTMNSFALQLEKRVKHSPDWYSIVPTF